MKKVKIHGKLVPLMEFLSRQGDFGYKGSYRFLADVAGYKEEHHAKEAIRILKSKKLVATRVSNEDKGWLVCTSKMLPPFKNQLKTRFYVPQDPN